jgi:hypothetical protein
MTQKWQPIETAPKDKIVLLAHEYSGMRLVTQCAYSFKKGFWWPVSEYQAICESVHPTGAAIAFMVTSPTHWMPLPQPPKVTK